MGVNGGVRESRRCLKQRVDKSLSWRWVVGSGGWLRAERGRERRNKGSFLTSQVFDLNILLKIKIISLNVKILTAL